MNAKLKKRNIRTLPEALAEAFAAIDNIENSLQMAMEYLSSIEPFELHVNSLTDTSTNPPCSLIELPNRKRLSDLEYAIAVLTRVTEHIELVQESAPTTETANDIEKLNDVWMSLDEAVNEAGLT